MKLFSQISLIFLVLTAAMTNAIAQDYACMKNCTRQGADLTYCAAMCRAGPAAGGMLEQPGLPRNPAFDQVQPNSSRPQLPAVADPQCMKDCQKRGYSYTFCYKKMCAYTPFGQ